MFCQRLDLDSGKKIGVWKFSEGGCSCQRSDLDSGKKIGVLEIWEGVFCQRSDLDSEKKIGVLVIFGGAEVFLPIWSKISGSLACLCITDSLSHTRMWRLIKQLD